MELRQLETLVAVAEEGSFTRAARRLNVVQSAVSATIRTLERELDSALFERTTHRVALTDAGAALLPEARRTLAAAAAAREAVDHVRGGVRGTVTLGTMQAQAMRTSTLAELIATFRAEHPDVEVRLRQAGSVEMAAAVRDGSLDLALVGIARGGPAGVTLVPLSEEPMQLVSGSEHPRARRRSVQLGALVDEPFAELPRGWGTTIAVDAAFAAAGLRRTVAYEINDAATVFDFVRHGLAVAILPPSFLDDATGIAFTPIRPRAPVFERSLAIPANRRPSAAATALRDTIARRAGAEAKRRQGDAGKPPQSPGNLRGE
jgi:DNA-binding transcriptional LysR family regulator